MRVTWMDYLMGLMKAKLKLKEIDLLRCWGKLRLMEIEKGWNLEKQKVKQMVKLKEKQKAMLKRWVKLMNLDSEKEILKVRHWD